MSSNAAAGPSSPTYTRKRTKQSCSLCRQRKTRCELPDPDNIIASDSPLPHSQACHRCKVLHQRCIVRAEDPDSARPRKIRKRHGSDSYDRASATPGGGSRAASVHMDEQLQPSNVLKIFDSESPQTSTHSTYVSQPLKDPETASKLAQRYSRHSPAYLYHGDPLRITAAMLRKAYGDKWQEAMEGSELKIHSSKSDLLRIYDSLSGAALSLPFEELLVHHPYLPTLETIVDIERSGSDIGNSLLLAIVLYLCALLLHPSSSVISALETLVPLIYRLREMVLLQAPTSVSAPMALDMLTVHAPFGTLPHQIHREAPFEVARGQLLLKGHMTSISTSEPRSRGPARIVTLFSKPETWLWASHYLTEGKTAMDVDEAVKPKIMNQISEIFERYTSPEHRHLWNPSGRSMEDSRMYGKLFMCECLGRMSIMERMTIEMRQLGLSHSEMIPELAEQCVEKLAEQADVTDEILCLIQPDVRQIPAGWRSYRQMTRLYDIQLVWRNAYRFHLATSRQLNSHSTPSTGSSKMSDEDILDALRATLKPSEVLRFFKEMDASGKVQDDIQKLVVARLDTLAQILIAFTSVNDEASDNRAQLFRPWHQSVALAVDASAFHMEVQAFQLLVAKDYKLIARSLRSTQWELLIDQAAAIMEKMEGSQRYTISSFCSNLVKLVSSMSSHRRLALARRKRDQNFVPVEDVKNLEPTIPEDFSTNFTLDWLLGHQQQGGSQMNPQAGDIPMVDGFNDPILQMLFGDQPS